MRQGCTYLVPQRQAAGDLRQRRKIEPVRLQFTMRGAAGITIHLCQMDIAARPMQSVGGAKLQSLG